VVRNDGAVSRPGRWRLGDRHGGSGVSPEGWGLTRQHSPDHRLGGQRRSLTGRAL